MVAELTREELHRALDRVAWGVLAEAGWRKPPVDAVRLARALGFEVALDRRLKGRARFVRPEGRGWSQGTILLRPEPRRERRQWAVMHELGESAAGRVFRAVGIVASTTPPTTRERIVNELASRLLLPARWFYADGRRLDWDVVRLKERYDTASHELVARRMLDFSLPVVVTILDQGRLTMRRSNVGSEVPPLCDAELACWRTIRATRASSESHNGSMHVSGWPIHDDKWQREIIRTQISAGPRSREVGKIRNVEANQP